MSNKLIKFKPEICLSKYVLGGCNIGNRFFRRFNVIINSTDTTYILYKRKIPIDEFTNQSFGVFLLKTENKIIVGFITINKNLVDKKINLFDEVVLINGKTIDFFTDDLQLFDFQNDLLQKNSNLTIQMKDGKIYTFIPVEDDEIKLPPIRYW